MKNLVWLLFSFEGRINRAKWWLATIILLVVGGTSDPFSESGKLMIILLPVYILSTYIWVAVGAKRLHDRDTSGWWQAIPCTSFVIRMLNSLLAGSTMWNQLSPTIRIISGLAGIFTIAIFIFCGFLKGTVGTNKYGSDPLTEGRI